MYAAGSIYILYIYIQKTATSDGFPSTENENLFTLVGKQ